MSQFFDRNKKKGLVGLLYLFREKKKVATLVLVAVAGAGGTAATVLSYKGDRLPGPVARVLRAARLAPPEGARPAFSSKAAEDAASRIYVPGSIAGSRPGVSSMEMVQGGNNVLQAKTLSAERLGGKTIQGVGRPENARGIPPGIPLSESEMKGGLARGDAAAVVRAGEAGADEGAGGGGRQVAASTAPASRILVAGAEMSGARAVRSGPGGLVQRMSESRSRSLDASGGAGGGGQLGRLSAFSQEKGVRIINAWNAGQGPSCDQTNDPLCELVVARAASKAGAKSLTNCPSCPKESGTHMAATSFDGKSRKQAGVVTSDDETPPDLDGQYVDSLIQEGDQFYEKINNCDDVLQSTTEKMKGLQDNVLAAGSAANEPYQELKDLERQADEACAAFSACLESCHALCSLACAGAFIYAAQCGAEAYLYQVFKFEPKYQDYADACSAYNEAASTTQVCEQGQGVSMFQCRAEEEFPRVQETRHWQFACGGQSLQ